MSDTAQAHDTRALEALFFVSDEPLTASVLSQALELDRRTVEELCERLAAELEQRNAGLVLRNVAGGWRLFTHPDAAPIVERFVLSSRQARLTKAALETLAIVAYKQPVTRHQVSAIRGVNSDGVLRALVDRGLIDGAERDEGPGRAVLFSTSPTFLERLGLPSLSALPSLAPLLDGAGEEAGSLADAVAESTSSESTSQEVVESNAAPVVGPEDGEAVEDGPTTSPTDPEDPRDAIPPDDGA